MKKILLVMSVAILMALFSAPSIVKADHVVGNALVKVNNVQYYTDIWVETQLPNEASFAPTSIEASSGRLYGVQNYAWRSLYFIIGDNNTRYDLSQYTCQSGYIPTLINPYVWTWNSVQYTIYNNSDYFIDSLPEEFRPIPSISEQRWDAFYEWYKLKFGYYPVEGSLIDLLRKFALGDDDVNTEIYFPTTTPTPTPTPQPTSIPVQTIFVPDGNGGTTVIYQYTDPTTGVITQSPYNPNIENNIEINCDCDDDNGNGIFSPSPQDPTALTSSMLWADGFGVEITDNPLTAANDSQKSLAEAAAEYSDSVNVVSNSFNVLPFKWLVLVGLLGGILIIAGLLRTFLGG